LSIVDLVILSARLVVFDLDGTLVDSRRDLAESVNEILGQCGCPPLPEDAIGRMVGDGAATLVDRAFEAAACGKPPDALVRFLTIYNGRLLRFTRPYPGIPDALTGLSAHAELAVLTNKPLHAAREILSGLGLAVHFRADRVIGGDGPFLRKPDPAGLLHLAASAAVRPHQTVLVGDSIIDWQTAHAAGTRVCLARYGFGFDGFPVAELGPEDRVADEPATLISLLY
jgi:phosphoglycolate phosphatase